MKNQLAFQQIHHSSIVFLHGFLGSGADFEAVISRLGGIAIDLPGHGETRFSSEYTMSNTADAIVQLLDELQIEQTNLVGYSMGGRLALYLALNYPERFPKAVIESGSPGLKTEQERIERRERDRRLANQLTTDFNQFLINWYNQPLFASFKAHPNFEDMLKERSRNNPMELARSLLGMGTGMQPSLWEKLKTHQNPLLLIVGECDRKFVALNQEMASRCETAKLAIVSNSGHNVHFEKLDEFVDRVTDFLENC